MRPSDEAIARMEALVRRMNGRRPTSVGEDHAEAREIVKLLPEPVDPDVLLVRRLLKETRCGAPFPQAIDAGDWDDTESAKFALTAIRASRA